MKTYIGITFIGWAWLGIFILCIAAWTPIVMVMVKQMTKTLVFNACYETHVFINEIGSITIRQIAPTMDDVHITIPIMHIEPIVNALRKAKRETFMSIGD